MERVPPGILRRMGYKADSQGVINRYINVNGAWESHLNQTRRFILTTLADKPVRNLAVYGSGWLLDLPLSEISSLAGHVWLYDVVHPRQVLHRIESFSNITAITADVTGGALMAAYDAVRCYKRSRIKPVPEQWCCKSFEPLVKPDYVISLNMLSQVGELITNYLQRHIPFADDETERMIYLLQQSHLKLLPAGASCLITDVEEQGYDASDRLIAAKNLIKCPLPVSAPAASWEWHFDPIMEYRAGSKTVFRVMAFEF